MGQHCHYTERRWLTAFVSTNMPVSSPLPRGSGSASDGDNTSWDAAIVAWRTASTIRLLGAASIYEVNETNRAQPKGEPVSGSLTGR